MTKRSKRHHYLPQCYLQRFTAEDGLVCLFDREDKGFRRQAPVNTALQKDFYTIVKADGSKSDGIEQMLSGLEGVASSVTKRLDAGQNAAWKDEQERVSFAMFIAFFYTRTPVFDQEQTAVAEQLYRARWKAENPTLDVTAKRLRELDEERGEEVDQEFAEEFHKMIHDDAYDVEIPRQNNIRLMVDAGLHLTGTLLTLNWTFVSAPPDFRFITSDAPFTVMPPPGEKDWRAYGILTPGAASTIPLSPDTCLVIQGVGGYESYGAIKKDTARRINHNVALNSDRFIIGRDQPYLERLVKRTGADRSRWSSRFEFDIREIDGDLILHGKRSVPTE